MTKIYGIRNKATGEFVSYNSKCAWSKIGNAKNAFNLHSDRVYDSFAEFYVRRKFDEQDEYEIVDLTECFYRLEGLCK